MSVRVPAVQPVSCQPRPWRSSTTQHGQVGPIPDLVARDFSAPTPGRENGRRWTIITGRRSSPRRLRWPPATPISRLMRCFTQTGAAITSAEFTGVLERLGIRQSVGRIGIFDNALADPFNAAPKVERVHRAVYPTRKKAHVDIARYIEIRYKPRITRPENAGQPTRPHRDNKPTARILSGSRQPAHRPRNAITGRHECGHASSGRPSWPAHTRSACVPGLSTGRLRLPPVFTRLAARLRHGASCAAVRRPSSDRR